MVSHQTLVQKGCCWDSGWMRSTVRACVVLTWDGTPRSGKILLRFCTSTGSVLRLRGSEEGRDPRERPPQGTPSSFGPAARPPRLESQPQEDRGSGHELGCQHRVLSQGQQQDSEAGPGGAGGLRSLQQRSSKLPVWLSSVCFEGRGITSLLFFFSVRVKDT